MTDSADRHDAGEFEEVASTVARLDRAVWQRSRRRHTRARLAHLTESLQALDDVRGKAPDSGDVHLVVVPHDGPDTGLWTGANGNQFFEIYTSAVEILGPERVTLVTIPTGEPEQAWQERILEVIAQTRATHVIGQIERDPNKTTDWNWDVIAAALGDHWDGVLIAQMYDAGFDWLRVRAQRVARLMPRLVVADLGEPMNGYARKGQIGIGPMTLPLSQQSVAAIDAHVAGLEKKHDVTFIGALYDYRIELLERLRASGFAVAVNPHRTDTVETYLESRENQPGYLDYLAALAQSELTINFCRASSGPREHYKIRVQEAALVGCLCITDDQNRTRGFFAADEYATFDGVDSLEATVTRLLADRSSLHDAQARARTRAHELARLDYWGRIDDGLRARGLPELTGLTAPGLP